MWWIIGIAAYIVLLIVGLLFMRGASSRECPTPQSAQTDFPTTRKISPKPLPRWQWDQEDTAVGGGRG
jgi:cell division protein FtsN